MRSKYLLFVLFAVLYSCNAQDNINNSYWNKMNLKGNVKVLKQINYEANESFGEITKGKVKVHNQLSHSDTENEVNNCYRIHFNNLGQIQTEVTFNSDGTNEYLFKYYYKSNKLIRVERLDYENHSVIVNSFSYDELGNATKSVFEDNNANEVNVKYILNYDVNNRLSESQSYVYMESSGWLKFPKKVFEYNDNGTLKRTLSHDTNNQPSIDCVRDYNSNLDVITAVFFNSDGSKQNHFSYQYTYDSKKNWTKKLVYINDVLEYITERQFEYY